MIHLSITGTVGDIDTNERMVPITTGCLKKNARLCLTGHRGYQKWTINKSRVSFEMFRKFPFK